MIGQEERPSSQEETNRKGIAGINAHLNSYEHFLEDQEKDLYQKLYIEEATLESYLTLVSQSQSNNRKCLIAPGQEVAIKFMSRAEVETILKQSAWKDIAALRHPLTRSTLQSPHNQYLIEFYDGSGVWVATKKDLDKIKHVYFEKSKNGAIHWWSDLDKPALNGFIKSSDTKHYSGPGIRTFGQKIYQLPKGKFILAEGQSKGKLFENKLILLRHLFEEKTYQTEAKKLLVNHLLKGNFRTELYDFLFYLNPIQLKEVLQVYGASPFESLELAEKKVEGFRFESGAILYNYPGYGFCRLFENDESLAAYKASTTQEISDPEFTLQASLKAAMASNDFPSQIPALTKRLAKHLNINPNILDGSEKSLKEIGAVYQWNATSGLDEKAPLPFVAYVGEVIRKKYNGKWEVQLDSETNTWIPAIREDNGKLYILSVKNCKSSVVAGSFIPKSPASVP